VTAAPGEGGVHRFALRVYYEDTDAVGIVYYANYLNFAERARTEMLRHLGIEQGELRRAQGIAFAVQRCVAEYLAPARLDDVLMIETRPTRLGRASLEIEQRILSGPRLLTRLAIRIACLGPDLRPKRLPAALHAALSSYLRQSSGASQSHG
jgi:acyl-CoA thioester hydrolase